MPARITHAAENSSHVGKTADYSGHGIIGMNFILKIDVARVLNRDQRGKYPPHRHNAVPDRDLTLLALEVRKVLHVHVE